MKFTNISAVQQAIWTMRESEQVRGENRSLINQLFNGEPPYTSEEREQNNINTNVNFLEPTKLAADARRQFTNAFLKPGRFLNVSLDFGPTHKRDEWARVITREINRQMKDSLRYVEVLRSTFASVVLHGIGPVVWNTRDQWCPDTVGIEDVLLPSNTFLTMENLEFFAIHRSYTPAQLWRMTHGFRIDPGWNVKMAEKTCKQAATDIMKFIPFFDPYEPEKITELYKSDPGLFATSAVQTIDCWDFFYKDDEEKSPGWCRKIVIDVAPGQAMESTEYLYDSGSRRFADSHEQIVHFQFGDASSVAPFRYHSVRSLGHLLYAVCHLQNRLRCRVTDCGFENLMMLVRVDESDRNRIHKVDLHGNVAVLPKELEFVKGQDRYIPNMELVSGIIQMNRQTMTDVSASYTQDYGALESREAQTATETMAQVNAAAAMVGAMLTQAYRYQVFQYREIGRRFCKKNSPDLDVRTFRKNCLKAGVPKEALNHELWNIECEQVLGAGNKTLELQQANMLMQARNLFDPEPQREILHKWTEVVTDNPDLANRLAPILPQQVSNAVHDAQLAAASLMLGLPVAVKTGLNHIEYVEALLMDMQVIIQRVMQTGGVGTPQDVAGLQNMAQHIVEHIQIIAQDPEEKERVKRYMDALGEMMNAVKAMAQRQQEMMKKQAQGNGGGMEAEVMGKIQAQKILAEAKAANMRESHAQRTAQRQVQWEMEQQRKQQEHGQGMRQQFMQTQADIGMETAKQAVKLEGEKKRAAFQKPEE